MKKMNVTRAAAREIARLGETPRELVEQIEPRVEPWRPTIDMRPAVLASEWTQNDVGLWRATAFFLVGERAIPDASFPVSVVAPLASERPDGEVGVAKLWLVWRGRWEAMTSAAPPRYVGRLGVGVGEYDHELDGYPIDNYGVRSVRVPGESYEDSNGTLYFSPLFFRWTPSSLDIGGKKEINLKTISRNLVTDVVNGRAIKETFIMLGTE